MPDQFTVPQFIDAEDKIFGPVTARQFVILMMAMLIDFTLFKLLNFIPFLIAAVPILVFSGILAFVRINGQPFHYFMLNLVQTFKKPGLRVWSKQYTNAELKELMKQLPPPPTTPTKRKSLMSTSHLAELSLVVNTGGVYKPEE